MRLIILILLISSVLAQSSGGGGGGHSYSGYRAGAGGGGCSSTCERNLLIFLGVMAGLIVFACCCDSYCSKQRREREISEALEDDRPHDYAVAQNPSQWNQVKDWKGTYTGTSALNQGEHEMKISEFRFEAEPFKYLWKVYLTGNDTVGRFEMEGKMNPFNGRIYLLKDYINVRNERVKYVGKWDTTNPYLKFIGHWTLSKDQGTFELWPVELAQPLELLQDRQQIEIAVV